MKRFICLAFVLCLFAVPAHAAVTSADHAAIDTGCCGVVSYDHSHSVKTTQDWGGGIGADVVLLKTGNPLFEEVTGEVRHDFENRETRAFAVLRVDLFEALADR